MFRSHIKGQLSAYCNGELAEAKSRRISEHLLSCQKCRREYEQIKLGARLATELRKQTAPDQIWSGIEELIDANSRAVQKRSNGTGLWTSGFRFPVAAAVGAVTLMIAAGLLIYLTRGPRAAWGIEVVAGDPRVGSNPVPKEGKLYVGQWLETDSASRAILYPGAIGEVKVEPGNRVRVIRASKSEYRLSLEHGTVEAKISAPPRLFFVDTLSAEAIDLGCAYTLDVDNSGNGSLHVTAGLVELVLKGRRKSTIPAEAACLTRRGVGPGTPYFEDASPALKDALERFDFAGASQNGLSPLDTILSESRKRDSLTLWHLLYRTAGADRARVYDRLAELVPPPNGATKEVIMRLDQSMLDEWWLHVVLSWYD